MRVKKPDVKNAQSLFLAAKRKMQFTLTLPITPESASTITSNIYECFRMLGNALYAKLGIIDAKHKEAIGMLFDLKVETEHPIANIKNLRRLRHNVNYYGYEPTLPEVKDVVNIAKIFFDPLLKASEDEIKR